MAPIVGLEPTYSRFLNSFKVPSESLNGISGQTAFGTCHSCLNEQMDVCLSRLSLKFLRDGSVNVGHYCNTAADFCSSVRLLHSSVGVGFCCPSFQAARVSSFNLRQKETLIKKRLWMGLESNQLSTTWCPALHSATHPYECRSFPTAISIRKSDKLRRAKTQRLLLLRRVLPGHNTTWRDCPESVPRTRLGIRLRQ